MFLCIDTTTPICSVALGNENGTISSSAKEGQVHAEVLAAITDELLQKHSAKDKIKAVFLSMGPGSYTGLRIGTAYAKGLCFGLGIPLVAIDTLQVIASHTAQVKKWDADTLFRPMIDARRMEVYTALFNYQGNRLEDTRAVVVDRESFGEMTPTIVMGTGATKCMEKLSDNYTLFPYQIDATQLLSIGHKKYLAGEMVEEIAYFEPLYLKDFVATMPKKSILG